jgi:hypothetical protein
MWRILMIRRRRSGVRRWEEEGDRWYSVSFCQREREVCERVRAEDATEAKPLL